MKITICYPMILLNKELTESTDISPKNYSKILKGVDSL